MEDNDVAVPEELTAIFRFMGAGGELFETKTESKLSLKGTIAKWIGDRFAGGTSRIIIDFRIYSKPADELKMYETAIIDDDGQVRVPVDIIEGNPKDYAGINTNDLRPVGNLNAFVYAANGGIKFFTKPGEGKELKKTLESKLFSSRRAGKKGLRALVTQLLNDIKKTSAVLEKINIKKAVLCRGITIQPENRGEIFYDSNKGLVVPGSYFANSSTEENLAKALTELQKKKNDYETRIENNTFFQMRKGSFKDLGNDLAGFDGAKKGNLIIDESSLQVSDKKIVRLIGKFNQPQLKFELFVSFKNTEGLETKIERIKKLGFSGYKCVKDGKQVLVRFSRNGMEETVAITDEVVFNADNYEKLIGLLSLESAHVVIDLKEWNSLHLKIPRDMDDATALSILIINLMESDRFEKMLKEQTQGLDSRKFKLLFAAA
jgi:hypothetical protein